MDPTPIYDDFYQVSWKRFIFPAIHPKGRVIVFFVFWVLLLILGAFFPVWTVRVPLVLVLGLILFP